MTSASISKPEGQQIPIYQLAALVGKVVHVSVAPGPQSPKGWTKHVAGTVIAATGSTDDDPESTHLGDRSLLLAGDTSIGWSDRQVVTITEVGPGA